MSRIEVVSFRLGGLDGVSIEAAKWVSALRELGHDVHTIAGDGTADVLISELALGAATSPSRDAIEDALHGADVVIVENLMSLPLNRGASNVLSEVLSGRRAIVHHHDLPWQREQWINEPAPLDDPSWLHVTINDISKEQLAQRGIEATTLRNTFDCDPPQGDRDVTRTLLSIGDEQLLLFPSRAIPRKNVAAAFHLAEQLGAVLWLLGPAEDDFEEKLERLISNTTARVRRGAPLGTSIHDAYAASDLVVVPSTWEGFGNPVLESVTHQRPLAVYPYPVLEEIRSFGFSFFDINDVDDITSALASPQKDVMEENLQIAGKYFSVQQLPRQLHELLTRIGVS